MPQFRLKTRSPSPEGSFSWQASSPSSPGSTSGVNQDPPPTSWLPAHEMKVYGAEPLFSVSDVGVGLVRCKACDKPVMSSSAVDHAVTCASVRAKKGKGKGSAEPDSISKKRKASPSVDGPAQKKAKAGSTSVSPTKPNMRRHKGPVDLDKQCGVINDKGLPCSRSLTCKTHSVGAKRSVEGRSRLYNDLLLDWQRAHNPNFVEPQKKETKAEKKAKKDAEKAEKKKLAAEAAAAQAALSSADGTPAKKSSSGGGGGGSAKKSKKASGMSGAGGSGAGRNNESSNLMREDQENLDELDSEAEIDELVKSVRAARTKGAMAVPLAVPAEASSWFVQRRERARCCRELLERALNSSAASTAPPSAIPAASIGGHRPSGLGLPPSISRA
ncbi:SCA7-domain-containing protein [Flagelloscypha sp. PMI_526]|nr:SCA7-domain-containing protein [Flagelloscypha sp. PMI_526]